MKLDPHAVALLVVTTSIGFAMAFAGVQKNALEWRRRRRVCPSCGRFRSSCGCN